MVTVPRGPQQRIPQRGLPPVPVTTRLPIDIAGIEQVGAAGQRLAGSVAKIVEDEQNKVLRRDFSEEKDAWDRFMIGVDAERKAKLGKNARFSTTDAEIQLLAFAKDRLKGLKDKDPRLSEAMTRYKENLRTGLQADGAKHEFEQDRVFTEEVYRASQRTLLERAAAASDDPPKLSEIIEEMTILTGEHARDTGKSKDWLIAQAGNMESKIHVVALRRMNAEGRDLDAKNYLRDNKANMTSADRDAIQGGMREGSIRGEARRLADKFLLEAVGETEADRLKNALDAAKKIEDVDVRRMAENNIKSDFRDDQLVKSLRLSEQYETAARLIDQSPGVPVRSLVDSNDWASFDAQTRRTLERRALDRITDVGVWDDFRETYLDPDKRGELVAMTRQQFDLKFRRHFSRADQKDADRIWGILKSPPDAAELLETEATQRQIENDVLTVAGMDPNPPAKDQEGRKRVAQYRLRVRAAIRAEQAVKGRKLTEEEMTNTVNRVLVPKVMRDRSWLRGDIEVNAALVLQDERESVFVPIGDIPSAQLPGLRNKFRANRREPTDDKLQRYYAALLIEDDELAERILLED